MQKRRLTGFRFPIRAVTNIPDPKPPLVLCGRRLSEDFTQCLFTIVENVFELPLDIGDVGQGAEYTEGEGVVYLIEEADAPWGFGDFVVVVPKLVGSDALLIDE